MDVFDPLNLGIQPTHTLTRIKDAELEPTTSREDIEKVQTHLPMEVDIGSSVKSSQNSNQ